jgi:hypothetical protein
MSILLRPFTAVYRLTGKSYTHWLHTLATHPITSLYYLAP